MSAVWMQQPSINITVNIYWGFPLLKYLVREIFFHNAIVFCFVLFLHFRLSRVLLKGVLNIGKIEDITVFKFTHNLYGAKNVMVGYPLQLFLTVMM